MATSTARPSVSFAQQGCALYELPGEIRNMIWSYYAAPLPEPHLHIQGGKVYDFCTSGKAPKSPLKDYEHAARSTSIIRTCRAFYDEVTPFLYDDTTFDLILRPDRPARKTKFLLDNSSLIGRLERRRQDKISSVQHCTIFCHISKAYLTLHAGPHLDMESYVKRTRELLKSLSTTAPRLHYLKLCFYFPYPDTLSPETVPQIIYALHGVAALPALGTLEIHVGSYDETEPYNTDWAEDLAFVGAVMELHDHLRTQRPDLVVNFPVLDDDEAHVCHGHVPLPLSYLIVDMLCEVLIRPISETTWVQTLWLFAERLKVMPALMLVGLFLYACLCTRSPPSRDT